MRARGAALAMLLLLAPALPGAPWLEPLPTAAAQATIPGVSYPWWDPAWHMRMPVMLEPRVLDHVAGGVADLTSMQVVNYPATVELDFTKAIRDAGPAGLGWPKDSQGRLSSFTFDPASVRVVEHDRFKGCMLVVDRVSAQRRCFQPGDKLTEALVPATFAPGLWENRDNRDPFFDPERNAVGTMQWAIRGAFAEPRLYYVYFDIAQNGAKAPATYRDDDRAVLDGFQFVRSGTDIIGFAPGTNNMGTGLLMVQALYDNTTISVGKYTNKGAEPVEVARSTVHALHSAQPSVEESCTRLGTPLQGTVCVEVPQGQSFFFRVKANRPVLAALRAQGEQAAALWYPARDGGLLGSDFVFRAAGSSNVGGSFLPLYVMSPGGATSVQFRDFSTGSTTSTFLFGGFAGFSVQSGARYGITSDRPVLVAGSGNDILGGGIPLLSTTGSPVGARLLAPMQNDLTLVNQGPGNGTLLLGSPWGSPDDPRHYENVPLPQGAHRSFRPACSCSEVWRFDAKNETQQMWGKSGEVGLIPLGGQQGGQRFEVSLQLHAPTPTINPLTSRVILIPQHNSTRVTVANASDGKVALNTTLGLHGWIDLGAGGQPQVGMGNWVITASKPVYAYFLGVGSPEKPYAAYYSARTEPPLATLGPGEFHGFAVGWDEKVKTAAVAPGERVRLKLNVLNLGRGVGAQPITDDITLGKQVSAGNGTPPDVDLSSVLETGVPSFQGRGITLSIAVPADAATGTVYQVNLTARSAGNPAFTDTARVIVTVQIRYSFAMQFVETSGPTIQKIMRPDAATCMDIEVRNTGTGDVSVRLQMSPTKKSPAAVGFDPRLQAKGAACDGSAPQLLDDDGSSLAPLVVARGQTRSIALYVKAPADTRPLPLELTIQGAALEDASVREQLSATVFTNVEAKVRITALNATRTVLPGSNATYDLLIENIGDVETNVLYSTTGLLPQGWNVSFEGAPPVLKGRGSVDSLGQAQDRAVFNATITAARDAPVALVVPLNAVATSAIIIDTGGSSRAFRQSDTAKLTAVVGNNFTLVEPEPLPLTIDPGEPFELDFELRNGANGNFTLRVLPGALPRNWTIDVREPREAAPLAVGDRLRVRALVTPEVATKAGPYEVSLALLAEDPFTQAARFRNVTLAVRSAADFRVLPEVDSLVMAPGSQRDLAMRAVNSGNLPVSLRLVAAAPPGYQASFTSATKADLLPGESFGATLRLRAPDQPAETGPALRITGIDDAGGRQREFTVPVVTGQVDLVVTQAVLGGGAMRAGEPAVVVASVQNRGTITANNVGVALLVDGQGVRAETLRSLAPGEPRTLTLVWTVDRLPTSAAVAVDPEDRYTETDEGNNRLAVDLGRSTPGPGALEPLLAALAALGAARAARRKTPPGGPGPHG